MKHIPIHCPKCNTDFDLVEDDHGYMGVCDCCEWPEDLELEDTITELSNSGDYLLEKRRGESQ